MSETVPPRDSPLLLAIPLLITVHNAEEALGLPRALALLGERFGPMVEGLGLTRTHALWPLLVATLVPWLVWAISRARGHGMPWLWILVLLQCLMLANAAWHLLSALGFGAYMPGLATALLLNLPFSIYLLLRVQRERWLPRHLLPGLLLVAALVHVLPVLILFGVIRPGE
jgi:hypothetical protein